MNDVLDSEALCCEPPQARLVLCFLGPPQVMLDGQVVMGHRSQKALALMAYLAIESDRSHPRGTLAALFWPNRAEQQALQDLRQTLSRLRRTIGDQRADPPLLLVKHRTIQFNRQSSYWLDVEAFERLMAQTERHRHRRLDACPSCVSQLTEACEYCRGEFLQNFHPAGSLALDEWLLVQRERLQQKACVALQALSNSYLARGEPDLACQYARSLRHLDPWNEKAQRLLLRSLTLSEGRNAALLHYEEFRKALAAELRAEPEDRTLKLVESIRNGALSDMQPHTAAAQLPTPATPFVGRGAERSQITEYLAGQDQRLVSLCGPGGSGKTRLALEVAAEQAPLWRDGVWFTPLAETPDVVQLVDALAVRLQISAPGKRPKAAQLIDFFRSKELLLILDGFEHLLACPESGQRASIGLLEDILRAAPDVCILVTSRTRLGVRGEWSIPVQGLLVPTDPVTNLRTAEGYSAVKLFLQSARQVAPAFRLTTENSPHIARICRLVDGLPLGIELAAAWVRLYRCRQIADEIEDSLDFLHAPGIGSPQGHHSLRGTFGYSYNLLTETERVQFLRLSVFRGGFTLEAARQVAGAHPPALDALLDKSLLWTSPARRLDLHPTLREYAAEKLAENANEEARVQTKHSRLYLTFLRDRQEAVTGEHGKEALDQIQEEMGNVRAAWHWAVAEGRLAELDASLEGLSRFCDLRGFYREAEVTIGEAVERLPMFSEADDEARHAVARRLACRLLVKQAGFLARQGRYSQVLQVAAAALESARAAQDVLCEAKATFRQGEALWRTGHFDDAQTHLTRALSLVRTYCDARQRASHNVQEVETGSLSCLAGLRWMQGHRTEAESYLQQALDIAIRAGNQQEQARLRSNLGVVAVEQGKYTEAQRLFDQSLKMHQASGNRRGASIALGNLGNLSLYLGAYAQARSRYEQALHIQHEIGGRQDESLSIGNLGLTYHYSGDHETARDYSQRALEIAQDIGERRSQGAMWLKLGHALAGLGQLDGAAEAYQQSVTLRREMGTPSVVTEPLAGLARMRQAQGNLEQARAHAEEILDHLDAGGTLEGTIMPMEIYLTCYRVLKAGQDPHAEEVLTITHEQLQARASQITDGDMRRSFLENVQPHRDILREYVLAQRLEQKSESR